MTSGHVVGWYPTGSSFGDVCVEIERNGERTTFRLDSATAERLGIATGIELDDDTLAAIERRHRTIELVGRLHRFLSYRLRSSAEVIERLRRAGANADDIRDAMEFLGIHGFIDDERFARAFVRDHVRFRSLSAAAIRRKLIAKGVAADIAERVLRQEYPHGDEFARALAAARTALRRSASLSPEKRYRRIRDHLIRRGYSSSVVRQVLRSLATSEES